MTQDTVAYDSLKARPLPKWLTNQRDGLNTWQPEKLEMKKDDSLKISFASTGIVILITIIMLTIYFLHKKTKKP